MTLRAESGPTWPARGDGLRMTVRGTPLAVAVVEGVRDDLVTGVDRVAAAGCRQSPPQMLWRPPLCPAHRRRLVEARGQPREVVAGTEGVVDVVALDAPGTAPEAGDGPHWQAGDEPSADPVQARHRGRLVGDADAADQPAHSSLRSMASRVPRAARATKCMLPRPDRVTTFTDSTNVADRSWSRHGWGSDARWATRSPLRSTCRPGRGRRGSSRCRR